MRAIHILLNALICMGVLLTILMVGALYIGYLQGGYDERGGLAILGYMLYGTIFAGATFAVAAIGYLVARQIEAPSNRIIRTGLTVSVLGVLLLAISVLF